MNPSFKERRGRIGVLTLTLAGLFAFAVLRLVVLVALDGARLNSLAQSEHSGETKLAAVRGPIVDRSGEPLALSAETRSVYARPHRVLETSTPEERRRLAKILGLRLIELNEKLNTNAPFVWLERRIPPEQAQAAEALGIDGIGSLSEYKRFYPGSNLAASVVGLAGMDGQGLSGLELQYDRMARGEAVELSFYHDALGHPIFDSPLALKAPEPGAQLELTIDSSIQSLAETELTAEVQQSGAKRGSAIVLDPFTGEVMAMANVGADPASVHDRLHNPAVQDAFEPGSTMKGILGSIALADHAITLDKQIFCENGRFRIDRRTIHDHSSHGWLNLGGIIEVSSNIGAAKIALTLGSERYYEGLRAFGIGSRTGIDLPGEAAGMLSKPAGWKKIDLANHGFGQGVAVTPMQLAVAYAAIANGGNIVRPYVVKGAYDAEGRALLTHTPQVIHRAIAPDTAHQMNLLLRNVVMSDGGTAAKARVDGFIVAGKTGTAQMVNPENGTYFQNRHVSSFVGFLPADDPRLLILVVLYDVGHEHFGGLVAAPVFSEIAQGAVRNLNITAPTGPYDVASIIPLPDSAMNPAGKNAAPAAAEVDDYLPVLTGSKLTRATPNFSGLSLRRAIELARVSRVNVDVHGAGYVVAQEPKAGAALNHSTIKLTLAPVIAAPVTSDSTANRPAKSSHAGATGSEIVRASYFGGNDPAGRK
jgi:cell division protein FtsI (penicillin-binding protein 3)